MTINAPGGIGSLWRRWDLHVHTPSSIVHQYGGSDNWDRFLTDLAALPSELSVVGINDYLFVDGYRRVLDEWRQNRLTNLEAVFPVIEFRLQQLAGVDGALGRINYHVIFDQGLDPDVIDAQFLHGLAARFQLSQAGGPPWSGFLSRANVESFGSEVRASLPPERRAQHNESDLALGFNNLVLPIAHLRKQLGHTAIAGRAICAIGKAEWSSFRWTDQSIASKKDLINGADIVFTAASSPAAYMQSRSSLKDQGVNDHLLDCSDAHHYMATPEKDRIGNCFTWLRAQPTLNGLKHAMTEFDHRVFVGDTPPKVANVRARPGDHFHSVVLRRSSSAPADADDMFDVDLPINPGFVAVVGNKGKGKSALLDVLGLAAGSTAEGSFTFLSSERFRNPLANRAAEHEVVLTWCDGDTVERNLDEPTEPGGPERVTYLPQRLLDEICSADPGEPAERFARQLGQVLFAHVPPADRLGAHGLDELIASRSNALDERLAALRLELADINRKIVEVERDLRPEHRSAVQQRLNLLRRKLAAFDATEPEIPDQPSETGDPLLTARVHELQDSIADREGEIEQLRAEDARLAIEIDAGTQLRTAVATLTTQVESFRTSHALRAQQIGLSLNDMMRFEVDRHVLDDAIQARSARRETIRDLINVAVPSGPGALLARLQAELAEAALLLDEPARRHAAALTAHDEWEQARTSLVNGSAEEPGIEPTRTELATLDAAPEEVASLRDDRRRLVGLIHTALMEKVRIYEDLYRPARNFIHSHDLARACELTFGAALRERHLERRFFDLVNRGVAGTFTGISEGAEVLRRRAAATDFTSASAVIHFVDGLDQALREDQRSTANPRVDPERLVRVGHTLEEIYNLVFGLNYLDPYHSLRYQGVAIDQLSPGENGTLLLMFYLLVDPARTPLLLDQPDENLDNHTVKDLLVPAIKEASTRRQVIVVTHNPNVAIVADADQIVVAGREEKVFTYLSGAIEDGSINLNAVDVLEGTWPALDNRTLKYQRPSS